MQARNTSIAAALLALACSACGRADSASRTAAALQPGRYRLALNQFVINRTRAPHRDTDFVSFQAKIGDRELLSQTKFMGDLGNGRFAPGLSVDFDVAPGEASDVTLGYVIVNNGHNHDVSKVLDQVSQVTHDLLNEYYKVGPLWDYAHKFTTWLNKEMDAGCDGLVAQDRFTVDLGSDTQFSQTKAYSYESQFGCGASPRYEVTWSLVPL